MRTLYIYQIDVRTRNTNLFCDVNFLCNSIGRNKADATRMFSAKPLSITNVP